MKVYNDELYHHGVKGQKWGVRRYQNKDGTLTKQGKSRIKGTKRKKELAKKYLNKNITTKELDKHFMPSSEDVVYKKGTTVNHITPFDFKKLRDGQDLFVSADDYDKNLYRAFLSTRLIDKELTKTVKEVEFTLEKDLVVPSNDKQIKIYNKFKETDKSFNEYTSYNDFIKKLDTKSEAKTKFLKELKSQGYNGVLDTHDITDTWMQAKTPIIVIDAVDTLGNLKVKDLFANDINSSIDKVINYKN